MLNVEVLRAANQWWIERQSKGAHHFILRIMPFLFEVIESLYLGTRKLPLHSVSVVTHKQVAGDYEINFGIFLELNEYSTLRVILSLMGDIYNLLTPLIKSDPATLMELSSPVQQLYSCADKFREVRNCFTHLDEVLTNMDKHGITGAAKTNCGIEYTSSAKGCVHLIWQNNVIHFTYKGKVEEITVDKSTFDPVFQFAKQIYSELISHKNAETINYTPVEKLFPA
ncbi:MAG: hypothetical protein WBZ20_13125 [Nitrososphaeraceae archaeon]